MAKCELEWLQVHFGRKGGERRVFHSFRASVLLIECHHWVAILLRKNNMPHLPIASGNRVLGILLEGAFLEDPREGEMR